MRSRAAAPAVTALIAGCGVLNPDLDRVIGLELEAQQLTIMVGDSAQLVARAVNGAGEVVTDAVILWAVVDTGQVGFTLDTATGAIAGMSTRKPATRVVRAIADRCMDAIIAASRFAAHAGRAPGTGPTW